MNVHIYYFNKEILQRLILFGIITTIRYSLRKTTLIIIILIIDILIIVIHVAEKRYL